MITQCLHKIADNPQISFNSEEVRACLSEMLDGSGIPEQVGAFLMALRMRGITPEEFIEIILFLREKAVIFTHSFTNLVDNCGTGGDGKHTFNISTAAALIAAAAGAKVAKHGNRSASSRVGSADVLEELGIRLDLTHDQIKASIEKTNFGFFFAPLFHPVLKQVASFRKNLKIRTFFNLVGPLLNPAQVRRQLLGVASLKDLNFFSEVFKRLGAHHIMIVHGNDGVDELTLTDKTYVCELKEGRTHEYRLEPWKDFQDYQDWNFSSSLSLNAYQANSVFESAQIIEKILSGEDRSQRRKIVVLNAAALLYVGGVAKTIREGLEFSDQTIDSGKALKTLHELRNF